MGRIANTLKEDTHERIVKTAARVVRHLGYAGVGVADVMKEAGLTHGGFYAHFESRNALLVEAVNWASKESSDALTSLIDSNSRPGKSRFRALVEAYLSKVHLTAVETGCPIAALSSDMSRQEGELRMAANTIVKRLIAAVRAALSEAHASSAEVIAAQLVGSLQLARAMGNNEEGYALLIATRTALLERYDESPSLITAQ